MAEIDSGVLPVAENDQLDVAIGDHAVRAVAKGKGPDTRVREVSPDVKYCFEDEPVSHVA